MRSSIAAPTTGTEVPSTLRVARASTAVSRIVSFIGYSRSDRTAAVVMLSVEEQVGVLLIRRATCRADAC